jgi:hypothetical protein
LVTLRDPRAAGCVWLCVGIWRSLASSILFAIAERRGDDHAVVTRGVLGNVQKVVKGRSRKKPKRLESRALAGNDELQTHHGGTAMSERHVGMRRLNRGAVVTISGERVYLSGDVDVMSVSDGDGNLSPGLGTDVPADGEIRKFVATISTTEVRQLAVDAYSQEQAKALVDAAVSLGLAGSKIPSKTTVVTELSEAPEDDDAPLNIRRVTPRSIRDRKNAKTKKSRRRGMSSADVLAAMLFVILMVLVAWVGVVRIFRLTGSLPDLPPSVLAMRTTEHEGHLWVIGGQGQWGSHHPDCPCRDPKTPEAIARVGYGAR